ncbi:MAG: hypothetical protein H0V45_16160 [Actinobacteria bacterium]|nr:hypothetical protein [Actinomycetota bacterium]
MNLLPASPRRRRRLARLGVVLAVALAVLVSTLVLRGPADDDSEGVAGSQANVYVPPEPVRVTKEMRRGINATLDRFVPAAVRREDPMAARDLATPGLRASATRKQWERGEIPVYPFRAKGSEFHGWTLNYSIPNNVNVDLMVQATAEEKEVSGIAYTVDLRRVGGRWLVESFFPTAQFQRVAAPNGSRVVAQPDLAPTQNRDAATRTSADVTNRMIALVPLLVALIGVLLVIGVFVTQYLRGKKAERDYLAGRL